ncbi:dolichyldiphosphatase 1 isoform X4 [Phacochoerus africanus]|uniref:dolichyldiphosphatase 1 isoform X4 n=1 Tax=Phacochoerus africanus TaxID=41426 RepID=UPI001FD87BC1|nr:dolichyldiphosphatase 1 isoform X4 [Phacochoerus africanus]XP_047624600.1 dolichyldiphosphatase 1 isoform X4 [Phacochoerus africanus]
MAADGQCSLPASWRPVTLTHVEYPAGDLSGHLLAYLSLSPIFVIVGFVTLIIFKRELHTISFLGGLALNEGVNWLIKHVVQEPRPCGGPHVAVGTKYGMPSSHSQFMWFFSVYSFLFLYLRLVFPECTKRTMPGSWTCCGGTCSPWVSSLWPFSSPIAGSTCCTTPGARCSMGASLEASWPSPGLSSPRRSSPRSSLG